MGGNFTGVKNQILTRLLAVLAAAGVVAVAAELSLAQPVELAAQLAARGARPAVFMVGPNVLYRSKHMPGSVYAGPAQSEAGLAMLKAETARLPRDSQVVVYCGCCPWDRCPNVKPAVEALRQMGFSKVKAAYLPTGFKVDWLDKGYPSEAGK